jgi:hypothetical protein
LIERRRESASAPASTNASAAIPPPDADEHPQPPSSVLGVVHTRRARHTPALQVSPAPHGPTTWSSVHGSASGGIIPPHARCSMHCITAVQRALAPHSASPVHSGVGAQ